MRGDGDAFAGEVDEHDPLLGPRGALVSEDTRRRLGQAAAARVERGRGAAERQEPAVEVGDRARVPTQALDAPPLGLGRPREPGRYGPAVPRARVPWDRRAAAVPAAGIDGTVGRDGGVLQPELLALVEERRPAQRQQEDRGRTRRGLRPEARPVSRHVVVGEDPRRPRADRIEPRGDVRDALAPRGGVPGSEDRRGQLEDEVQLVIVAVVPGVRAREQQPHLAHQHAVARIGVDDPAERAQDRVRRLLVVQRRLRDRRQVGREVRQPRVLPEAVDDVDPEAVDAAGEPEAEHVLHGAPHVGVGPVQVGLLGKEEMEVVLPGRGVEGPCRRAAREGGEPVVRRAAAGRGVAPDVPGALRARARGARLAEPRMLVGGVVRDPVEEDADAARVRLGEEPAEVGESPEEGIDVAVVCDVVPEVLHGGAEDGREPHRVDTEPGEMVEPTPDALEVAHPVTARVGEGARIDLVDDRRLPPRHGAMMARKSVPARDGLRWRSETHQMYFVLPPPPAYAVEHWTMSYGMGNR